MTNNKRTAETILKYSVDQRSVADVRKSIQTLKQEQAGFNADLGKVGAVANSGIGRVRGAFDSMRRDIKYATNDIEKLRRELELVGSTRVAPKVDAAGGRSLGGNLENVGRQLFALPSLQVGGGLSTDQVGRLLRGAGSGLDAIGASAGQLAVAGPIAAGALVAVGVAFNRFNEQIAGARRNLEAALVAQENYYTALGTLTTQGVEVQIAELERTQAVLSQQVNEARGALEQGFAAAASGLLGGGALGDAATRIFDNQLGLGLLRENAEKLEQEFNANAQTIVRLRQGLEQNVFATNDAAAAERALAEARTAAVLRNADDAVKLANTQAQYTRMTSQQVEAELDRLRNQTQGFVAARREIQNSGDTSEAATSRIADYSAQIQENQYFIQRLMNEYRPLIEAREREEAAIKRQIAAIDQQIALEMQAVQMLGSGTVAGVDQRLDAINAEQFALSRQIPTLLQLAETSEDGAKRLEEAQKRMAALNNELVTLNAIRPEVAIRQFNDERAKLNEALTADISRIEQARDARIAQLRDALSEKEAEAEIDRAEGVSEARRDAHADREKQEEQHQKNLKRIVQRANATIANAIANRDALAAFLAEQQKQQELKDEADANKERLKAIDDREKEVLRTVQKRYDDQIRTARAAADRAIRLERDKATAEISTRQAAYNAELQQLQANLFAQYSLQQQFWNAVNSLAARKIQSISQQQVTPPPMNPIIPQHVYAPVGSQAFLDYTRGMGIPGFAAGGVPPIGRPVIVGELGPELVTFNRPARVHSAADTRRMGGAGAYVQINFDGKAIRKTVKAVSRNEAIQVLYDTFVEAGIA